MTNGSKIVLTISSEIPHPLSVQEITIESDIFSAQRKIDPFESVKVFSETASFAFCRRFYFNFMHGLSFRNECSGGRCIYGVSCR